MNICPIAYTACGDARYSPAGLRRLSPRLRSLADFPYDAATQRREAVLRAGKMSIAGVQPKLSVVLSVGGGCFELVDHGGNFIVKPQHEVYPTLPENEGLTMHLARQAGFDVPPCGLVCCADGTWSYFIRRFERLSRGRKRALEDFAQLADKTRDTKYEGSLESTVAIIDRHCTFPKLERVKLLRLALFSFLVGNEDLHLKNFSLLTDEEGKVAFSPAYDLLSSTTAYWQLGKRREEIEESALPLAGKKRKLTRRDWIDYFARERLELPPKVIDAVLRKLADALPMWRAAIAISFLDEPGKALYRELLDERAARLALALCGAGQSSIRVTSQQVTQ